MVGEQRAGRQSKQGAPTCLHSHKEISPVINGRCRLEAEAPAPASLPGTSAASG